MINVHGERLPEYQNAQSVIWPIFNMERTTGLTIHEVDDHIDTGKILYKDEYEIYFQNNLKDSVIETLNITSNKVPGAVLHVCENYESLRNAALPQNAGKSYTTPSFWSFLKMVINNKRLFNSVKSK
jgi:methionyl-tRNA formyltransferase